MIRKAFEDYCSVPDDTDHDTGEEIQEKEQHPGRMV